MDVDCHCPVVHCAPGVQALLIIQQKDLHVGEVFGGIDDCSLVDEHEQVH